MGKKQLLNDTLRKLPNEYVDVSIMSNMFVTYDNFSELIRKIRPTYIFFLIYILSNHQIPVPIGIDAKVFLIHHWI